MTTLTQDARKLAKLTGRKRELEEELTRVNKDIEAMQEDLLDAMADEDVRSLKVTVDGQSWTISPRVQRWARFDPEVERETAVRVMQRAGLAGYLMANTQSLSAWVRERTAGGGKLPPSVDKVLDIYDRTSITARKAN